MLSTLASCGRCRACATGHPTWCPRSLGNVSSPFTYRGQEASNFAATSAFAERTVVSEVQAIRIDPEVPFESACLIGCAVMTGVGAVLNRARVGCGETAAVFGIGGVGLNVVQGLRIAGASRIIAVDTMSSKKEAAELFGATDFVDSSSLDPVAAIRDLCPHAPGRSSGALGPGGVRWAFDCVGHPGVLRSAIDVLDWGGMAVALGIPPRGAEVSVDVNHLAYVDRGVIGCRYGSSRPHHDIPLLVELYRRGDLLLDELVSITRPLDGFGEIVEAMHAGSLHRGVLVLGS